ncbi:MAG: type domain protein [Nitrososphaeraceae archaeon]|jgi:hypothetical protein|nr:type domain protein [Nitrososphaeraceae archaeon]MCD6036573.1 type domain protein [Nitrososphaeraceae archaeon]
MADKRLKFLIFGFIILTIILLPELRVSTSHKMISADLVLLGISNVNHHLIAYAQEEEEDDDGEKKEEDKEDNDNGDEEMENRAVVVVVGNGVDKFGIEKLYPAKTGGGGEEEWYMNMLNPIADERFKPMNTILNNTLYPFYTLTRNTEDGSWKLTSTTPETKVRMHIFTSTGYNQSKIATYDHTELEDKGYMQSPNDWKNIEMTGYVKLNDDFDSNEKFQWFNRGGIHYTSTEPNSQPCEGVGYKGNLFYSGHVRFAKEQWHVSYEFTEKKENDEEAVTDSSIEGKWIGYKYVVYNIEQNKNNGKTVVKMENWLDMDNDGKDWIKVDEHLDDGEWGDKGEECGGAPDQIITWGGPVATFRWDNARDVDFKNLSVREIEVLN